MLDEILKYQEIEKEKIALENELANSKDRNRASEIQKNLKDQHSRLITLENSAKKVNDAYLKSKAKYEEYQAKLDELEKKISADNLKSVEQFEKLLSDFVAVSNALEKEIQNLYSRTQQINKEYEEIIRKSKVDRGRFDKFRASFATLKNSLDPKIASATKKLGELEAKIDPKVFSKYKQKRESRIFPVFVPLTENKCGGCRMEISASKLSQMKSNDIGVIECENCGRYIFAK